MAWFKRSLILPTVRRLSTVFSTSKCGLHNTSKGCLFDGTLSRHFENSFRCIFTRNRDIFMMLRRHLGHLKMGSVHEAPIDTPALYLRCSEAFNNLESRERKFAHHLSRASWWGQLIVLCQRSPESPLIFNLLTRVLRSQSLESLKKVAIDEAKFSEDDFKAFLVYFSCFIYNSSNYLGFGDSKFIPSIPREKFETLLKSSKAYSDVPSLMDKWIKLSLDDIYNLDENKKFYGLPPQGVTMYFTPNCSAEDAKLANDYMSERNFEAWNNRLIKHEENGKTIFDIRVASVEKDSAEGITVEFDEFKNNNFRVTRGDYSSIFKHMNEELNLAKEYVANGTECKMINKYIESFTTGSIKAHKQGSTFWVNNKSPAIETYMGFIEVYSDPTSQRAEFESFVAMVNREQSRKFDTLVDRAEKEFLPLLPWGTDFEEDIFMRPDFSSLDILTFATAGLPIGINIPNYKDVKEEEGFKNVSLSNVMAARTNLKGGPFLSESDAALKEKHGVVSLDICVGLHELLGHGCGKFLRRKDDGTLNFDPSKVKNPFTGGEATFYEIGENYNSAFTNLAGAYEECRAETVALYLCLNNSVLDIFGVSEEDREDMKYISWFNMFYSGLRGLEMYQPSQSKWGQAHSQARYVILRVALEAGEGLVSIEEFTGADGLPDLRFSVDRSKIKTVGYKAIGDFLTKLQVYRSLNDAENGRSMFAKYSEVPNEGAYPFARWHEIVVRKRKPRMVLSMPNTKLVDDSVEIISYPDGLEGMVSSWVERFSANDFEKIESYMLNIVENWRK